MKEMVTVSDHDQEIFVEVLRYIVFVNYFIDSTHREDRKFRA